MGAMNAEEMKNYKGVFVFAQQVDNKLSGIAFELIGEGKETCRKSLMRRSNCSTYRFRC